MAERGHMTAVERANAAKRWRNSPAAADSLEARARRRVERSPRLRKYYDVIFYEWFHAEDHLRWVIRGRVAEIEAWARQRKEESNG